MVRNREDTIVREDRRATPVVFKGLVRFLVEQEVRQVHHLTKDHLRGRERRSAQRRRHRVAHRHQVLDRHPIRVDSNRLKTIPVRATMGQDQVHSVRRPVVHRNLSLDPDLRDHLLYHPVVVILTFLHRDKPSEDLSMACHREVLSDREDIQWGDQWDRLIRR